jgi:M6 family metalloprotease-like protein
MLFVKAKIILLFTVITLLFSSIAFVGCAAKKGEENVNLVIQVEFLDTESLFSTEDNELLLQAFNGKTNSLDNFIYVNSNGKRTLTSTLTGVVKINKAIDYFMPKYRYDNASESYVEENSLGYDNRYFDESGNPSLTGKQSAERFYREQELVYLATAQANNLTKKLGKNPKFENLTIVPSKLNRYVYSGDIFHPHQANNFTGSGEAISSAYYTEGVSGEIKVAKIQKAEVGSYVIIPYAYMCSDGKINVNTLCHEYMHVLGLPDLYPYDKSIKPVGEFDVMGGESTLAPNQSLAYVKYKMGWLKEGEDILPVTGSGEYNLTAVEDEGGVKAYKITLGDYYQTGDVFYLEYRKLGNGSLSIEQTEGVIIYRVNEENGYLSSTGEKANVWRGNAYGGFCHRSLY